MYRIQIHYYAEIIKIRNSLFFFSLHRLKRVTGNLVLDFQHAFVVGRQLLDAILIAK